MPKPIGQHSNTCPGWVAKVHFSIFSVPSKPSNEPARNLCGAKRLRQPVGAEKMPEQRVIDPQIWIAQRRRDNCNIVIRQLVSDTPDIGGRRVRHCFEARRELGREVPPHLGNTEKIVPPRNSSRRLECSSSTRRSRVCPSSKPLSTSANASDTVSNPAALKRCGSLRRSCTARCGRIHITEGSSPPLSHPLE
jgi:hypothetical protein